MVGRGDRFPPSLLGLCGSQPPPMEGFACAPCLVSSLFPTTQNEAGEHPAGTLTLQAEMTPSPPAHTMFLVTWKPQ